ncbi:MAG: hypothetical protein ABI705_05930 [Aestuariivirga sp.]
MSIPQNSVGARTAADSIPNGPGVAVILTAGIGSAAVGIVSLAAEVSVAIHDLLNIYNPVRPLSGKTTVAIVIWLLAWFVLSRLWGPRRLKCIMSIWPRLYCLEWGWCSPFLQSGDFSSGSGTTNAP